MKIIDQKNKNILDSITIMLTPGEALELVSKVKSLDPHAGDHVHINDQDHKREIIIGVYNDEIKPVIHDG